MNSEWMTPAEAAAHLGVSTLEVLEAVDSGEISGYWWGNLVRLRRDDLELGPVPVAPGDIEDRYPDKMNYPEQNYLSWSKDLSTAWTRAEISFRWTRFVTPFAALALAIMPAVTFARARSDWVLPGNRGTLIRFILLISLATALSFSVVATAGLLGKGDWTLLRYAMGRTGLALLLGGALLAFVVYFASLHWGVERYMPGTFSQELEKMDAVYFAMSTFATAGSGDIHPVTVLGQSVHMFQMVFGGLVLVALIAALVTNRALDREELGIGKVLD